MSTAPRRAVIHVREFLADTLTPLAVYQRLESLSPVRFLFESVTGGEQVSRFSFLGVQPREIYRLHEDRLEVQRGKQVNVVPGQPLDEMRRVLASMKVGPSPWRARSMAARVTSATSNTSWPSQIALGML